MRINQNLAALNSYRNLVNTNNSLQKSLERLSSGFRINRAADDAAGLAISEKMRGQIRGLAQAQRNAQDSISMIQTAEGSLNEVHSILQRMRELAVQASNDTTTDSDRAEIQEEFNQLTSEINRIGNTTEFNTKKLIDGSFDYVAATAASATGITIAGPITISGTATSGYAQGSVITDTGYTGSTPKDRPTIVTGDVDISAQLDISEDENEITFSVDGTQYEIQLTVQVNASVAALVDDINTELAAAGAGVTASVDASDQLVFTHDTAGSSGSIEIIGGNGADVLFGTVTTTSGIDEGDAWIHAETDGYTTGDETITDASLALGNITIDASNNELTLRVYDGTTWTEGNITLTDDVYDGVAGTATMLAADVEAQIQALGGDFATVTVTYDVDNTLKINAVGLGEGSQIQVTGGNAMDELFGATDDHVRYTGEAANQTLTFDLDGEAQTITLSAGYYDDADAIVSEINTQLTAGTIDAAASSVAGAIKITSDATGVDSDVNNVAGSAAAELGLDSATEASGSDGNTTLSIDVDGESIEATLQEGTYTDLDVLAAAVQSAINSASATAADLTVSFSSNTMVLTSGSTGASSAITVNTDDDDDAAATLGLTGKSGAGTAQENVELTFQIGANENQSMSLSISDMRGEALSLTGSGSGYSAANNVTDGTNNTAVEKALDVTTTDNASNAITVLDTAIQAVSSERSMLGASQNRLEHTITNLGTAAENLTAAESRIRDVDMAQEMMTFTKNQILSQAGTAMLAQANQAPQIILQLLR